MNMKQHEKNLLKLINHQRSKVSYYALKTIALLMMLALVAYVIFLGVKTLLGL